MSCSNGLKGFPSSKSNWSLSTPFKSAKDVSPDSQPSLIRSKSLRT
jgi:hypothetical protein